MRALLYPAFQFVVWGGKAPLQAIAEAISIRSEKPEQRRRVWLAAKEHAAASSLSAAARWGRRCSAAGSRTARPPAFSSSSQRGHRLTLLRVRPWNAQAADTLPANWSLIAVVFEVKPQVVDAGIASLPALGTPETVFVSIVAAKLDRVRPPFSVLQHWSARCPTRRPQSDARSPIRLRSPRVSQAQAAALRSAACRRSPRALGSRRRSCSTP